MTSAPTIDDVPSCGSENDYRRATASGSDAVAGEAKAVLLDKLRTMAMMARENATQASTKPDHKEVWEAHAIGLDDIAATLRASDAGATGRELIQEIYNAVNALGGRSDQDNSYDQGIVDTVAKVLEIIERAKEKQND